MATVTLGHNVTRLEDWEGTPPGTFGNTGLGGGPSAGAEAGLHYEATQCAARRIAGTNSARGFTYIDTVATDMTGAGNTIVIGKAMTALSAVINPEGTRLGYGDTINDYYNYQVGDDGTMGDGKFALPPKGGYVIIPIEVRKSAWHNLTRVGSPDLTIMDMYRLEHQVSATTGAGTSQAMDAVDVTDDGLFLWGGDGGDTDGVFQDFVDADEGAGLSGAGRVGIWTSQFGQFFAYLGNVVGRQDDATVAATEFTDSFFSVVFPGGFVGEGINFLEFDLGNSSTIVTLSSGSISGQGRTDRKVYFDTELDVIGSTTDTISIPGHGLESGDQVAYSSEVSVAEDIGPDDSTGEEDNATSTGVATTGNNWYINRINANTIQLVATAASAYDPTPTAVDLTPSSSGNGVNHSLRRKPDTRPDIIFTGTSGSATLTNVNLISCRNITLRSPVTLSFCQIVGSQKMILNDATLSSCTINAPTTPIGEAFLESIHANDLDEIDGCTFISGADGYSQGGHAIELTTNGTAAQDEAALSNVTFTGYFAADEDSTGGWSFNANTDVDAGTDEITIENHPFTDGEPVYYSAEGGTQISDLTDGYLYYTRDEGTNLVALFLTREGAVTDTNRIALTAGTSETHKLYSANAVIFNNTGTAITLNVTGGSTPTVRNGAGSTTSVVASIPLEINGLTEGSYGVMIGDGGAQDGVELLAGYANNLGVISGSYSSATPQVVKVRARNGGIIAAAIQNEDGVGFTDFTNAARDFAGVDDVDLLPATISVNDAFYFSGLATFQEVLIDVTTAGSTYVLTWEYWNSTAWSSLSVTDNTNSFFTLGWNTITFTAPSDWATTSVNSQGPFYYIRARVTTGGGTQPQSETITINDTIKYLPFDGSGTIQAGTGLTATAVWLEDTNNP